MDLVLRVSSEIGRLRRGLVHEPGPEVDRMVPAMMEQLLFDDILYGDRAREEFARFRRVLQLLGVQVLDAADLLEESLAEPGAREWLIEGLLEDLPAHERARLGGLPADELATTLVCGARRDADGRGIEAEELYSIPPLPNWCFQRDPQVVLGPGVLLCSMAAPARRGGFARPRDLPLSSRAAGRPGVVRRRGRRDSAPGRRRRARVPRGRRRAGTLARGPGRGPLRAHQPRRRAGTVRRARPLGLGPRYVYVVEVPRRRAYMHLDTLITQVDRDACLVYRRCCSRAGPSRPRCTASICDRARSTSRRLRICCAVWRGTASSSSRSPAAGPIR